ncbi:hypothetical protein ABW16_01750 [Mycolicibacter heraklionensis]|uniref:Tail terminator n=1 Tax=Mycolicibacter heraklionensis TaxID=512402 RepID=A0ABR5FKN1_9MYCO|nr:hypothetical protein [Mycolicibacter heraklionensis]KLO31584.1 hypothetical protein ABW16_01750 [Mycolicibacter heraklionensis]
MIDYGKSIPPEAFIIGALMPLGYFVGPEHGSDDDLPAFVVTSLHPHSDRVMQRALVSVATLGETRDKALDVALEGDRRLMSLTAGDDVVLPSGLVVQGRVEPHMGPRFDKYSDPFVKRYIARYVAVLRNQPGN